jgi:hypothetical protein
MNREPSTHESFQGFTVPEANWYRMPDNWTDISAAITNIAELKVVAYILRHTWGFREYDLKKHITIDEFVRGRRKRDGSRLDKGTGLSERAVRYGLTRALAHGFIEEEVDARDRARIKRFFSLRMHEHETGDDPGSQPDTTDKGDGHDVQAGVQSLHSEVHDVHPRPANFAPRTETNTSDHHIEDTSSNRRSSTANANEIEAEEQGSEAGTTTKAGFDSLRALVAQRFGPATTGRRDGRRVAPQAASQPGGGEPPPEYLDTLMREISAQLGDAAHSRSNISQARRLHEQSGLSVSAFAAQLHEAQSITRAQCGVRKLMPYFFQVLTDLLGLSAEPIPTVDGRPLRSARGP